jgi:acyl-CoA reductase-like NAD-dependent aldehyde dehydrogenase
MQFKSINPYSIEVIKINESHSDKDLLNILKTSEKTFKKWKNEAISYRSDLMIKTSDSQTKNSDRYAEFHSDELIETILKVLL